MQHRDIPKKTVEDGDRLRVAPYASRIAKGILNYSQKETFVVSLEGEWGSGKTSLMNFVENEIKEKVEILHFNPWLITGIEQIVKLFFDDLIKTLAYGSFNVKFNEEIKKDLKSFASLIIPENIEVDVGFIKLGYNAKDTLLKENEKSLNSIKESINNYLKELDKKIVIIIDDIDRLTDEETELIFRLVKGIADFDNLIYILLYDKKVIVNSLHKFKIDAEKYLQKIIQFSLKIPISDKLIIKELLQEGLDKVIKKENIAFDFYLWNYRISKIINNYVKTVRDVNQIISVISFEYPSIKNEVNFIDFIIVSIIRLKNHTLYEHILNNSLDFITDNENNIEKKKKEIQDNFENNLKEFYSYRDLLEIIFPLLNSSNNSKNSSRHKNKNISDIYYFENYFSFSVSDNKLSYEKYLDIEDALKDGEFNKYFNNLENEKKSDFFVEMFIEYNHSFSVDEVKNAFFNCINVIKLFDEKTFNNRNIYMKLCVNILEKSNNNEKFLIDLWSSSDFNIYLKIELVNYLNANGKTDKKVLERLKETSQKEINESGLETLLLNNTIFDMVFHIEGAGYELEEVYKKFNTYIFNNEKNFFEVLSFYKREDRQGIYFDKEKISNYIDLEKIDNYIEKIQMLKLQDREICLLNYWKEKE